MYTKMCETFLDYLIRTSEGTIPWIRKFTSANERSLCSNTQGTGS